MNIRSRGWTFTLNNYVEADLTRCESFGATYYVIGREVGESGTPHLQGYMYFEGKKSFKQLKVLMPLAHLETAKGTAQENYAYCTKDGNFVQGGVMPATQAEKGARGAARIAEMWTLAKAGQFEQLPPQNIKTWEYIHLKYQPPPMALDSLENLWVTGPSGSGKSSGIRKLFPIFYSKPMSKWWDGYQNEEVVVLDDFDPSHGKFLSYFLKIWADHYPFNCEVKGGSMRIRPKRIVVTSQYSIEECFCDDERTIEAVSRRFRFVQVCDLENIIIN